MACIKLGFFSFSDGLINTGVITDAKEHIFIPKWHG
jgi:hypothetical protein